MSIKNFIQQTILPRYDLGEFQSVTILSAGYANENYKLVTDKGSTLCRVVKQKTKQQLMQELQLLNFLKSKDFPTAYPIPQSNAGYINEDEGRLVVLYDFLPGTEPKLNEQTSRSIGDAVGMLNGLYIENVLQRPNEISLDKCDRLISLFTNANNSLAPILSYFEEETKQLKEPLATILPKGLVHGDVFTDNTVFCGNELSGIIDFEEACIDQLLFDVGITINGFCYPENKLNETLLNTLLKAYHNRRPLEPVEWELLPWFIRWGAHSQIYWHLYYGLLDHPNKKQMQRVGELMKRVEWARNHMAKLSQIIANTLKL